MIIENDGLEVLDSSVKPLTDWQDYKRGFIEKNKRKGIIGLGGAMCPSSVIKSSKISGYPCCKWCESEPYFNADNRLMTEMPDSIMKGMRLLKSVRRY